MAIPLLLQVESAGQLHEHRIDEQRQALVNTQHHAPTRPLDGWIPCQCSARALPRGPSPPCRAVPRRDRLLAVLAQVDRRLAGERHGRPRRVRVCAAPLRAAAVSPLPPPCHPPGTTCPLAASLACRRKGARSPCRLRAPCGGRSGGGGAGLGGSLRCASPRVCCARAGMGERGVGGG